MSIVAAETAVLIKELAADMNIAYYGSYHGGPL
jgi:hypothetical protein